MSFWRMLGGAALVILFTGLFGTAASLVFGTGRQATDRAPGTTTEAIAATEADPPTDSRTTPERAAGVIVRDPQDHGLRRQRIERDPPTSMPPASAGTNGSFKPPPPGEIPRKEALVRSLNMLAAETSDPAGTATLFGGVAFAPPGAPAAVQGAISAANVISQTPYVWGGGHSSWYASGYDCSGAVSFALHGGGLLSQPLTSGQLESYGLPGPGRWITIFANATHAYAVIAGLRWDTVGDARGTGPRWHSSGPYPQGFVVRHPIGY
jgi:cell wall-associated NlpC family hydrolase